MSDDLKPGDLGDLQWDEANVETSLKQVFTYALAQAHETIDWYYKGKKAKRWKAVWIRILAIIIVAVAGVIPVLDDKLIPWTETHTIDATWTYVFLAVAGALVLIDRLFGFSSGWMRYIKTGLQISQATNELQIEWEIAKAMRAGNTPRGENLVDLLSKVKVFVTQLDDLVQQETEAWINEFQSSLKQFDTKVDHLLKEAKARTEVRKTGSLEIVVTNGDQCDKGWTLRLDGGKEKQQTGKTAALVDLAPGSHLIRVEGSIAAQSKQAEKVAMITPGKVETVEIVLA